MRKPLAVALLIAAYQFANAGVPCVGAVQTLAINPSNGIVQVSIGYGVQYMCSVQSAFNSVDTQTCKSWMAMLLTAKASGKRINMIFDTTSTCTQIGNWSSPNPMPYWVEIVD